MIYCRYAKFLYQVLISENAAKKPAKLFAFNAAERFQLSLDDREIFQNATRSECLHTLTESGYYWIHVDTLTDRHGRANCTLVNSDHPTQLPATGLLRTGFASNNILEVQSRDHVQDLKANSCIGVTSQYRPADVTSSGAAMTWAVFAIDSDVIFSVINTKSLRLSRNDRGVTQFSTLLVNEGKTLLTFFNMTFQEHKLIRSFESRFKITYALDRCVSIDNQ
jgi:hypothetical protein